MDFQHIFPTAKPIIGVVHLLPLPGSPRWGGNWQTVIDRAEQEAAALAAGGADGIIVENWGDAPFAKGRVDPVVVSAMTAIVDRIANLVVLPIGLNVLRNDARSAIAIATCTGAQFIRVHVLTGAMVTERGIVEGEAYELLRYRRELGADVAIFADILVKSAVPLGSVNPAQAVREAIERGLADAAIVSGQTTSDPPSLTDLEIACRAARGTPVLAGSGVNWDNVASLLQVADGAIAASSLKRGGRLEEAIDPVRVGQLVEAARLATPIEEEEPVKVRTSNLEVEDAFTSSS